MDVPSFEDIVPPAHSTSGRLVDLQRNSQMSVDLVVPDLARLF
jgi:hypothetical protein